jgi:tRNA dimethylallyltransferase
VTVTHAAPFHLLADSPDGAPLRIRRTRAGDAWDRTQAESCGVPHPRASRRDGRTPRCRSGCRRSASGDRASVGVVGATGTGKTDLSLRLAEALAARGRPAEIVNADAMQLYRGMDIGTAKLPVAERRGIPHHLFDVLEVTDEAAVAAYQDAARTASQRSSTAERTPSSSAARGCTSRASSTTSVSRRTTTPARTARSGARRAAPGRSWSACAHWIRRPPTASTRATLGGSSARSRSLAQGDRGHGAVPAIPCSGTCRRPSSAWRSSVHPRRAPRRAGDPHVARGLLAEVAALRDRGLEQGVTASRAIGYAQALAQLAGELDASEAIAQTQALTRRYARRQVSWFRRYADVRWVAPDVDAVVLADIGGVSEVRTLTVQPEPLLVVQSACSGGQTTRKRSKTISSSSDHSAPRAAATRVQ